jgi:gas vesicle protein
MKLAIAAFGIAALVGAGYIIAKKVIEKRQMEEDFYDFSDTDENYDDDEEPDVAVYGKTNYSDKIRKASLFAVGAIKTGADKIGETFNDIKTQDMVKKGEQTFGAIKETGGNIKNDIKRDIEDLKSMMNSVDDDVQSAESDLFETVNGVGDEIADTVGNIANDIKDEVNNIFGSGKADADDADDE